MGRPEFSELQIAFALRQREAGTPVADVCRRHLWRKLAGSYSHCESVTLHSVLIASNVTVRRFRARLG